MLGALQFLDGLYGPLSEFRAVSEQMRFGFDEGLPGKAWASGHPVILKKFENSYFRRTEAAKAVGLTCGVAVPVFAGEQLTAVVVFFCGDDEAHRESSRSFIYRTRSFFTAEEYFPFAYTSTA